MWVRQCDLDAETDFLPPIPARIASNEEFVPPPQSAEQKEYEDRLARISDETARRQGRSRRDFLRSGSGMAAALMALNQVFGDCYEVNADEVEDPKAFEEKWPKDQFIFDVQTHHVDVSNKWYDETPTGRGIKSFFLMLRPEAKNMGHAVELLNRAHYVKEVFGDSDTVMAIISGVPSRDWDKNPLPPDQMVATRKFVNELAGSRRVLSHGLLAAQPGQARARRDGTAGQGAEDRRLENVHRRRDRRKSLADGRRESRLPVLGEDQGAGHQESLRAQGAAAGCIQRRGLPARSTSKRPPWTGPTSISSSTIPASAASAGWPTAPASRSSTPRAPIRRRSRGSATSLRILKRNPKIKNIYFELGSTFNILSSATPRDLHAHARPDAPEVAGPDHILWGTDSIWNGSPQSQIERMRRFKIADDLIEKYQISPADRRGQGPDSRAERRPASSASIPRRRDKAIKADKLSALRNGRRYDPATRSNTQYGWLWVEDGGSPTVPVGT